MSTTSSETSPQHSRRSRPGAAIVVWSIVAALQIGLGVAAALAVDDDAPSDGLYEYANAVGNGFVYLVVLAITVWIAYLAGDVRDTLGLHRFRARWIGAALATVVAAGAAAWLIERLFDLNAGEEQGILPDDWQPERVGQIAANAVVIALVAPLVEELFFRGAGVGILRGFGSVVAVVVSGLVFGLAHGLLIGLVPLALFGVGLAWVRLRSDSVWPGFVAHALYNGVVLALGLSCLADPECRTTLGCAVG